MATIDQRALGGTQRRKSIFPFSSVQQTFIERLLQARPVLGGSPSSPCPSPAQSLHRGRAEPGFCGLGLRGLPSRPPEPGSWQDPPARKPGPACCRSWL